MNIFFYSFLGGFSIDPDSRPVKNGPGFFCVFRVKKNVGVRGEGSEQLETKLAGKKGIIVFLANRETGSGLIFEYASGGNNYILAVSDCGDQFVNRFRLGIKIVKIKMSNGVMTLQGEIDNVSGLGKNIG